jgi:phosphate/sulfate permease
MSTKTTAIIAGLIGFGLVATFTIGLAISISSGFAGIYGGLPFVIIVAFVLILALYDLYETTIKKKKESAESSAEDQ